KRPRTTTDDVVYALYTIDLSVRSPARRAVVSTYLADLSSHPLTGRPVFRADLGHGVQLYELNAAGAAEPLVQSTQFVEVGGSESRIEGSDAPREEGGLSYQWAPDGLSFWYAIPRISPGRTHAGRRYDDRSMTAMLFRNNVGSFE